MKKQFFVYLFAALTLGGMVTSCSDDDNETVVVCPIEATTFNAENGLNLTYSGAPLLGKQVVFTPNSSDATKATLVLSGVKFSVAGMPFELPGTGVVPGEESTTLNLENIVINGDAISFEGVNEENGRKIEYKGSAKQGELNLNLNVTMPENALAGKTFNLLQFDSKKNASPITMDWVADAKFPFMGTEWDVHSLLFMVQATQLIEIEKGKKATLGEALNLVLNQVVFLKDGNIQAQYKDKPADADWKTSPLNFANYTVGEDGNLRLFINAEQIMAFEQSASRAGFTDLIPTLIQTASKLMMEGVPVTVKEVDGVMQFYLDEKTLLPIVSLFKPLLQDADFVNKIVELLVKAAGPEMAPLVGAVVGPLLTSLPNIIDNTSMMHFGINTSVAQ